MELWLMEALLSDGHGTSVKLMHFTQPVRPGLRFSPLAQYLHDCLIPQVMVPESETSRPRISWPWSGHWVAPKIK